MAMRNTKSDDVDAMDVLSRYISERLPFVAVDPETRLVVRVYLDQLRVERNARTTEGGAYYGGPPEVHIVGRLSFAQPTEARHLRAMLACLIDESMELAAQQRAAIGYKEPPPSVPCEECGNDVDDCFCYGGLNCFCELCQPTDD